MKEYYKSGQIVDACERFYNAGGRDLKVVRIAGTNKARATIQLLNGATPAIQLDAKYEGTYGNLLYVVVTTNGANRDVEVGNGVEKEKYLNLADNDAIVSALSVSKFVIATKLTNDLVDALSKSFLTAGNDGTNVTTSDYSTLLQGALFTRDWDYLTIPNQTSDAFHTTMAGLMDTRATNENRYSVFVTGVDKFEAIATTIARTATSSTGRLVVCHSALYDGVGDITLTGSWKDATYTAAVLTGKLCNLPVNTSPTFKSLAMIGGKSLANNAYNNSERESLISNGFIVVDKTFTNTYGTIMGVTRTGDNSVYNFMLDNQRKVDYIKDNVFNKTKSYIGQPNDDLTRKAIKASVTSFLLDTQKDRIIESYEVEVLKGSDPREVIINTSVLLINELDYITFNLVLNV